MAHDSCYSTCHHIVSSVYRKRKSGSWGNAISIKNGHDLKLIYTTSPHISLIEFFPLPYPPPAQGRVFSYVPKAMGRTDPSVFATRKRQTGAADCLWTWPGSEGKSLCIDLWEENPCTPVSLETDAHFIYLYLETRHAQQHTGGSKSCWVEFDRLLSHYGLPDFHDQRTIFCLWPTRPLLPLLPIPLW